MAPPRKGWIDSGGERIGKTVLYVDDGCEVTVTPSGRVFYNIDDDCLKIDPNDSEPGR
jgi:hypothetical protein